MNQIDMILQKCYTKKKYTELQALYELINTNVINEITKHFESNLRHEKHFDQRIYIDYQWIDKIPLAKFEKNTNDLNGNEIRSKVEIGDFVIQYRHRLVFYNRSKIQSKNLDRRAIIVQAKLTNEKEPIVPIGYQNINKANSTSKELKLLQDWPVFDLYETSRSMKPLMNKVDIINDKSKKAFFGGFNNELKTWLFGEAKNNEKCFLSYSLLLDNLYNKKIGKKINGADKKWDELFNKLDHVCINRKLPKLLNPNSQSRNISTCIKLYCFPFIDLFTIIKDFFKKKFLIILIDQIDYEGHNIEQMKNT